MDVQTEIKPWSSLDEWQYVKNCLLQKKLGHALEYIDLWKMRTHKLDGGKFKQEALNTWRGRLQHFLQLLYNQKIQKVILI